MDLNDYNTATLDISDIFYETIKASLIADKGYKLSKNPLETKGKIAIVRAIILADDQPGNGLIRVVVYFNESDDIFIEK